MSKDFLLIKEFFKEYRVNNGSVCAICEQVAETIITHRRKGANRDNMISLFKYVCSNIEEYDLKVCTGLININVVSISIGIKLLNSINIFT